MPAVVVCPDCNTKLQVAAMPAPGKKLRCPKCKGTFAPNPAEEEPAAAPAPAEAPAASSGGEFDFGGGDEAPPARKPGKAIARRNESEDEDDAPPKGRLARRGQDDGGDEDDAPRSKRGRKVGDFVFEGAVGDFIVPVLLMAIVPMIPFVNLGMPWVWCMLSAKVAEKTSVNGRRLRFTGTGGELFGQFIVIVLLCIFTLGIYNFWAVPRLVKWFIEHVEFDE